MDFSEIKELKFIFPQKKFYYFLTKLKAELWLMPGIRFFMFLFFKNSLDILFQKLFSLFLACYLQNYCDFLVCFRKND